MSPGEAGGTRHFEFARQCARKGQQFLIVASDFSYLTGRAVDSVAQGKQESYDGVLVLRAKTINTLHKSFVWRIVSFFSFMVTATWKGLRAGKIDLVMGTSPPIFQAFSAWLVSAFRGKPLLLEIRDLWPEFAIDMGVLTNPILIKLSRWLENFLYSRAKHILVNSPAYAKYLADRGIPENKISLISNGVDPAMFDPEMDGNGVREKYGLREEFIVTYAGALGPANDLMTVLEAAEMLKDQGKIHFLIVGDGKDRVHLEKFKKERNLSNVTFTGAIPKSEMPEILAASNACLAILKNIPMFKTTYPNKVFDYMAAGRPTLLAIDGVIREVIEKAHGGIYCEPGKPGPLAEAVLTLFKDPTLCRKLGAAARDYVVKYFNRSEQAAEFIQLIQRVSSGSW